MRLVDYKELMDCYLQHKTLKVSFNETIMKIKKGQIASQTFLSILKNSSRDKATIQNLFSLERKGKVPKDVWTEFVILETNSIDRSKLDTLIFQKSKDFFALEEKKKR